ncbi:MAG TPA: ABC transporter permease [Thermoanaerobaculia bacterium]|nr:ABC transporter permease [Thermoanaerobaculia bacterium]
MKTLDRMLVRDLWHLRGPLAAITVVVACGVATVVTTFTAYQSLVLSQEAYYEQYRFADVFASLKRAPDPAARLLEEIPGVAAVETRIVFEVTADVAGLAEPATLRLVSIPDRTSPHLNALHVRSGRLPEPGRRNEVVASEAFANANGLAPGGTVGAILNGRWETLQIVGVGLSPEYVYEVRAGDILPDNRRFGIVWMGRDAMAPAFSMVGAFNDVVLGLERGAREGDVLSEVDRVLAPWGGLGAVAARDQVSNRFLSDEIAENQATGTVIPFIFLGVSAFLLNLVLSRLVSTQREQIGVLKAFGYSNAALGGHYLKMALAAVLAGSGLGVAAGVRLGVAVNELYGQYFRFPVMRYEASATVIGAAVGLTLAAAAVGSLGAVRRAVRLPPAEAMRPEAPPRFEPGPLDRLGLTRRLATPGRIILRNLERRPGRAVLSAFGIALAFAILVLGGFLKDVVQWLVDVQFREIQREDMTIVFQQPRPRETRFEIARLPGVRRAEPFRAVPARLTFEHRSRRVALLGLDRDAELRRLLDRDLRPVPLPPDGLLLTAGLAGILGARPGDVLTAEVLEGARPVRRVVLAGVVEEPVGLSVYMERGALDRLLGDEGVVSGAYLRVDPAAANALYARLKRTPAVAGASFRTVALASFEETFARSFGVMTGIIVFFACAIAFAVVYNSARISLAQRARELASLRVLGFTSAEVSRMLLGEQAILTLAAVPLGALTGNWICRAILPLYQRETFRLPLVLTPATYGFAALVVGTAAVVSALAVWGRVRRLDLIEVLKSRE